VAGRASDSTDDPGVDASEDDVSEGESNPKESGEEEEGEEEESTSIEDSQSRTTAGRGKSQASTRSREGIGAGVLPGTEEEEEKEDGRAKRFSVGNMAAEVAVSESRCPERGRRASEGSVR
jgi:hypothetical protein